MTQKNKKTKGSRVGHRTGKILELQEISYKARILCWCGNELIIDSSRSMTDNECSNCGSPYKLMNEEWTPEEQRKYMELKGIK